MDCFLVVFVICSAYQFILYWTVNLINENCLSILTIHNRNTNVCELSRRSYSFKCYLFLRPSFCWRYRMSLKLNWELSILKTMALIWTNIIVNLKFLASILDLILSQAQSGECLLLFLSTMANNYLPKWGM